MSLAIVSSCAPPAFWQRPGAASSPPPDCSGLPDAATLRQTATLREADWAAHTNGGGPMSDFGVMQGMLAILVGVDPLRAPLPLQLLGMMLDVAVATGVVWLVWTALKAL